MIRPAHSVVVMLLLAVGTGADVSTVRPFDVASISAPGVGGVWVHPHDQHATIGPDGVLVLEVNAHGGGGTNVSEVQFTTDWHGWHVLCTDPASSGGNSSYSCTWNMKDAGVPPMQEVAVSFDVYAGDGSKSLAPNGIHYVQWGLHASLARGEAAVVTDACQERRQKLPMLAYRMLAPLQCQV